MSQALRGGSSPGDSSPNKDLIYWVETPWMADFRRSVCVCVSTSIWPCLLRSRFSESPGTVSWAQLSVQREICLRLSAPLSPLWKLMWETWFPSHCCRMLVCSTPTTPPPLLHLLPVAFLPLILATPSLRHLQPHPTPPPHLVKACFVRLPLSSFGMATVGLCR